MRNYIFCAVEITVVCYEKTGIVLGVCLKTIKCKKCAMLDAYRETDAVSETEYFEKYPHHEKIIPKMT